MDVFTVVRVDDDGEVELVHFDLLDELRSVCRSDGQDALGKHSLNSRSTFGRMCWQAVASPDADAALAPVGAILYPVSCLFHLMENGLRFFVEIFSVGSDVDFSPVRVTSWQRRSASDLIEWLIAD